MKTLSIVLILVLTAMVFAAAASPIGEAAGEYEIKAAMYVNLLRLVDWPDGSAAESSGPIIIGVAGSEDMAKALETIAASRNSSAARRIAVKRLSPAAGTAGCQTVFVGGADRKKTEALLQAVGNSPVLTVGENDRFLDLGGMIDLALADDRVQIEVNLDVARKSGLAISSQLLKIAVVNSGAKKGGGK